MSKTRLQRWLDKRLPRAADITLSQRRIFILPSKVSLGLMLIVFMLFMLGINFQNSLVYVVCFWLIGLLVVNIFYTYRNLAGLQVRALNAEPCFAGEKIMLELEVSRPSKSAKQSVYLGWKDQDLIEVNLLEEESKRIKLAHSCKDRGRFIPPAIDVFTRYPTGLNTAWSYLQFDIAGIVYPAPREHSVSNSNRGSGDESDSGAEVSSGSSDFGGIREYAPGDSPRHIHWQQFARTGDLYTKSFNDYQHQELWLDWDQLPIPGTEPRLSHLSAMVLQCHEQQQPFGLKLPDQTIQPAQGEAHKTRCLTALALFGLPLDISETTGAHAI